MAKQKETIIWVARDYLKCTGCRRCEIACSLFHEGWIWPEASRIRVFALAPGVEIPHFCAQCHDYPCVSACQVEALSVDDKTGAVLVDREKCTGCGACIRECPGNIPFLHPGDGKAVICDLCGGDPQCAKVCQEANFDALWVVEEDKTGGGSINRKLFAQPPEELARDVAVNLYGEKAEEWI
ncbi:4Fe-4S dicluster domain-containing protein [Candidatus Bathyarchaeota archaeon]|nr:4Fe-4S dicluster domain-containing protein [Candidatus Bathyarchaeota archaeon]